MVIMPLSFHDKKGSARFLYKILFGMNLDPGIQTSELTVILWKIWVNNKSLMSLSVSCVLEQYGLEL